MPRSRHRQVHFPQAQNYGVFWALDLIRAGVSRFVRFPNLGAATSRESGFPSREESIGNYFFAGHDIGHVVAPVTIDV